MTKSEFIDKYIITEDDFEKILQIVKSSEAVKPNTCIVSTKKKPKDVTHIAIKDYCWILQEYFGLKYDWVLGEYSPVEPVEE